MTCERCKSQIILNGLLLLLAGLIIMIFVTSCNYSITMIHTEGQASDVVDETASNTPSTSLSIPNPL